MSQNDDHADCKEIRPSVSHAGPSEYEDGLEDEIGGLFDELTQEEEKK